MQRTIVPTWALGPAACGPKPTAVSMSNGSSHSTNAPKAIRSCLGVLSGTTLHSAHTRHVISAHPRGSLKHMSTSGVGQILCTVREKAKWACA